MYRRVFHKTISCTIRETIKEEKIKKKRRSGLIGRR